MPSSSTSTQVEHISDRHRHRQRHRRSSRAISAAPAYRRRPSRSNAGGGNDIARRLGRDRHADRCASCSTPDAGADVLKGGAANDTLIRRHRLRGGNRLGQLHRRPCRLRRKPVRLLDRAESRRQLHGDRRRNRQRHADRRGGRALRGDADHHLRTRLQQWRPCRRHHPVRPELRHRYRRVLRRRRDRADARRHLERPASLPMATARSRSSPRPVPASPARARRPRSMGAAPTGPAATPPPSTSTSIRRWSRWAKGSTSLSRRTGRTAITCAITSSTSRTTTRRCRRRHRPSCWSGARTPRAPATIRGRISTPSITPRSRHPAGTRSNGSSTKARTARSKSR